MSEHREAGDGSEGPFAGVFQERRFRRVVDGVEHEAIGGHVVECGIGERGRLGVLGSREAQGRAVDPHPDGAARGIIEIDDVDSGALGSVLGDGLDHRFGAGAVSIGDGDVRPGADQTRQCRPGSAARSDDADGQILEGVWAAERVFEGGGDADDVGVRDEAGAIGLNEQRVGSAGEAGGIVDVPLARGVLGGEPEEVFLVGDGDAGAAEVEVRIVEERECRGLEGLPSLGDGQREIDGVVGDLIEDGVVDAWSDRVGDGPAEDRIELGGGRDGAEAVGREQFGDGGLSGCGGGLLAERGEGEEAAELGGEDAAHEPGLAHGEGDGGVGAVAEEFEEFEVVADGSGSVGDLEDFGGVFLAHPLQGLEESLGATVEVVQGEDEPGREVFGL